MWDETTVPLMIVTIAVLGLCVGSFINVCIYRLPKDESIVISRSHCPHCNHYLNWFDLIPVVSYMILRGKCRYCNASISPRYPIVELLIAFILLVISQKYLLSTQTLLYSVFLVGMFLLAAIDYEHYWIPDNVLWVLGFMSIPFLFLEGGLDWQNAIIGSALGFGLVGAIRILSNGQMGSGDVKLAGVMGIYLGWQLFLVAFLAATFIGAVVGVGLRVLERLLPKQEIPFVPFLALGSFIAILWGWRIVGWYVRIL